MAWLFLTIGIALGSWWAYYELGWGGWWFWDPVENASFMPWLVGTALIHSLAVTEKRGLFKSWTLLLAISAFSLSLLGTFLVCSGILVSVHAFATDPERGYFILAFLGIVIVGALVLYAMRAPDLDSAAGFQVSSRETFLLLNNILLVIAAAIVFYGTMMPLLYDVMGLGKISIGPPWFEFAMLLPMLPLVILLGAGMHAAWRAQKHKALAKRLRVPAILAVVVGIGLPGLVYGRSGVMVSIGVIAGVWIMLSSLLEPIRSWRRSAGATGMTRSTLGMSVAHCGVVAKRISQSDKQVPVPPRVNTGFSHQVLLHQILSLLRQNFSNQLVALAYFHTPFYRLVIRALGIAQLLQFKTVTGNFYCVAGAHRLIGLDIEC